MKTTLYTLSLLTFGLLGCSESSITNSKTISYNDFGNSVELKGEILPFDSLLQPLAVYDADSLLVFVDMSCEKYVQTYSKKGYTKKTENAAVGIGPNEILSCWQVLLCDSTLQVFDNQRQQILIYDKLHFFSESGIKPLQIIQLQNVTTEIACQNDETYAASCLTDENTLLSRIGKDGVVQDFFLDYPRIESGDSLSNLQKKRLFEYRILHEKKQNLTILMYVYTDVIDIYDGNYNLISRIHGPERFMPELIQNGNQFAVSPDITKFAYVRGCVSENAIWVLFYNDHPKKGSDLLDVILCFDLSGNPLKMYKLDMPIMSFCVNEKEKCIYGISEAPERCVTKYYFDN